jgi:hypothetical protein
MENLITKTKRRRVSRTTTGTGMKKKVTELEILRRAYEIYMETGVPYASEIEGLTEEDTDSGKYTDFKFPDSGLSEMKLSHIV